MLVQTRKIEDLKEYESNPRKNAPAVEAVAASIREFGFLQPIVIDQSNVIVAGHTRYKACQKLGITEVPCVVADDLTPEQIKAYRLADNKTAELAEWDMDLLRAELKDLPSFDMKQFGFESADLECSGWEDREVASSLRDKYVIPPFSVFDTRQGYWQERKSVWKKLIHSQDGRGDGLLGKGLRDLAQNIGSKSLTGTSIFDPVLTEILLLWFCPENGRVLDPFAGGSVRGIVSSMLGRHYTGIDLSPTQIAANEENYRELDAHQVTNLAGSALQHPEWICGDSLVELDKVEGPFDFILTCPPYVDLEKYSDDPRDISNMDYAEFISTFSAIMQKSISKLRKDAVLAIVVSDVRNKKGHYYGFIKDTTQIIVEAGMQLYNDCILVEQLGTAAVRADKQFSAGRKVAKTHQNVLVFLKGDIKSIQLGRYDYDFPEEELQTSANPDVVEADDERN